MKKIIIRIAFVILASAILLFHTGCFPVEYNFCHFDIQGKVFDLKDLIPSKPSPTATKTN